jgi:hypothetical protein
MLVHDQKIIVFSSMTIFCPVFSHGLAITQLDEGFGF